MDRNNEIEDEERICDIIQKQQDYYELFGYGSYLIYDFYPSKMFVEMKIEILLPDQSAENKNRLVDAIWSQRIHRGNIELLMSPIFVCAVYDMNLGDRITYPLNIKSKKYSVHPVFRIQKCCGSSTDANGQSKCCSIFVDELGRVYANWDDFRKNNKLDDCLVVAPKMGIYNADQSTNQVLLDIFARSSGVTRNLDTTSAVVSLVSAGVTGAALIPAVTVAPVVLGVAAGAGITCALYTGGRSVYRLFDRKKHKQSIGLKDKEARGAWINVGVGVLSASAAGATVGVARAVRNGKNVSTLAQVSARAVNVGAITVNVGACANESYSIIRSLLNGEPVSKQDIAQLILYSFLLGHSIGNYRITRQIMLENLADSESVTALLCVSQKDSFKELISRTANVCGSTATTVTKPIVRSLKQSFGDSRVWMEILQLLKRAQDVEIETVLKAGFGIFSKPIIREYVSEFDKLLNMIIKKLENKLNNRNLSSILKPLTKLLREITFKACNKFLQFIEQLVIEIAESFKCIKTSIYFERFFKMTHIEYAKRSAIESTSLNDFLLSKEDDAIQSINSEIRKNISQETLANIDTVYDDEYGSEDGLSESRKLELLIDEYAQEHTVDLANCSPAVNINELHDTIVMIFNQLPYEQAAIFFAITKHLLTSRATEIQKSLGRFISVDIFIVDIYCLLTKHSATNNFESLSEFLSQYSVVSYPHIEAEFMKHYEIKQSSSLKMVRCSTCRGQVFV